MTAVSRALVVLAALALAAGIGLFLLNAGDGLVTGQRGPVLGAFVAGNLATAVVFLTAAVLLLVGAVTSRTPAVTLAAALLLGGACVHVLGIAVGTDLLGGTGSTLAAFLGLGGASLAIAITPADVRPG